MLAVIMAVPTVFLVQPVAGDDYVPAGPWEFRSQWGWYEGDRVTYYDLGRASNTTAPAYRLVDGSSRPIEGQHLIFEDLRQGVLVGAPISGNYSDFHRIWDVEVPAGYVPNEIRSLADIWGANLSMTERDLVWNTPMVSEGSTLIGADSDLHPLTQGWWDGYEVHYLRFESSSDTPGLFDPGTALVRDARAIAVFDPPGQLEVLDTYPGEATYSPLTRLYNLIVFSSEFIPDTIRTIEEAEAEGSDIVPEGTMYNRPVVGGRETYPRYTPGASSSFELLEAWHGETSKALYYDLGPMTEGVAPLYRFVTNEGAPIQRQHWLVETVAPGVLQGDVDTDGYENVWRFHDIVVEDEANFREDVIKSMDDVRALGFTINVTDQYLVAPMVARYPVFLPPPSNPPGEGLALTWYSGADVYLIVLGEATVPVDTVNMTIVLDPDGEPYPNQRPIMENVPGDGNYSPVWSVVEASGGEGYRQGRFRTTDQLRERGWSFEDSGNGTLAGFVAGPQNTPAWKPQSFTFVVGPVVDEDDKPIKSAEVRVAMSLDVVEGTTDAQGLVEFEVDASWNGKTVMTFISKQDHYNIEFPAEIVDYEHFVPAGGYVPPMVRVDEGSTFDGTIVLVIGVVLVVIIVILVALGRGRSHGQRVTITEDEADEIFSEYLDDEVGSVERRAGIEPEPSEDGDED